MIMQTWSLRLVAIVVASVPLTGDAGQTVAPSGAALSGGVESHVVAPGDTLTALGARFGVDVRTLARDNGLEPTARLAAGRTMVIDNRHIVPTAAVDAHVVINIPQRMLFYGGEAAFPVAVGQPGWRTPLGKFTVVSRERDPVWDVPESIAAEARRQGRMLPKSVPPGPDNPLGRYWLGLSRGGVGLHGTNAPSSIYRAGTHGCIRLHPDDIAWLFSRIAAGATVTTVYEPVLLAEVDGRVFLEVHPDIYRRAPPAAATVRTLALAPAIANRIDWARANTAAAAQEGLARDVTARR
jgi:L,D-transpeptidase ErfK/SrfK